MLAEGLKKSGQSSQNSMSSILKKKYLNYFLNIVWNFSFRNGLPCRFTSRQTSSIPSGREERTTMETTSSHGQASKINLKQNTPTLSSKWKWWHLNNKICWYKTWFKKLEQMTTISSVAVSKRRIEWTNRMKNAKPKIKQL